MRTVMRPLPHVWQGEMLDSYREVGGREEWLVRWRGYPPEARAPHTRPPARTDHHPAPAHPPPSPSTPTRTSREMTRGP